MADNVIINSSDTVATDNIGGVNYQRVKMNFGDDGTSSDVSASNPLPVIQKKSSTATLTNVASAATNTVLVASNTSRVGVVIVNDSTQTLYVNLGSTASSTAYTYYLGSGDILDLTGGIVYTGAINGIWASANGFARITELT